MPTFIYSWNFNSEGASSLAQALDIKKIKHEGSKFKGSLKKTVVNWGSSTLPEEVMKCRVINKPEKVSLCSNKLAFFEALAGKGVSIPDWTTDFDTAVKWVTEGNTVCARTVLNGHSGNGLVLMDKDNPKSFIKAPLYTKYVPKKEEYRVHVFRGEVIDVQKKALRNGWIEEHGAAVNYKVRNLANGFIYMRNDIKPSLIILREAIAGMEVIGLDFGACDIVYNEKRDRAYLLEINCAPGIEGATVDSYAEALRKI